MPCESYMNSSVKNTYFFNVRNFWGWNPSDHPVRLFWNNWSSVIKNHNIDHYSNSIFITELEFENKNDIQSTIKNLEITLILIKLWRGEFSNSLFLSESHFWSKIQTQRWKLSWNNGQYCDFWWQNSNY